jgi:hypothetical protein
MGRSPARHVRPVGDLEDIAWTDRDYDDIRVVIGCPSIDKVEERLVRLIR